jgi:hypothetical protein
MHGMANINIKSLIKWTDVLMDIYEATTTHRRRGDRAT